MEPLPSALKDLISIYDRDIAFLACSHSTLHFAVYLIPLMRIAIQLQAFQQDVRETSAISKSEL
ncbi:MAG: hypothetical protein Q7P63_02245 [Verrucomicrobiota bacterium JB022]|nr:hypothetical protein [Verrucomicrobiota bacterium JB022]